MKRHDRMDATNSMGNAVELYFVNTLEGGAVGGVRRPEGIVIAANGDGQTLAHEVMHNCGLEDIYTVENPNGSDPTRSPGRSPQSAFPPTGAGATIRRGWRSGA